MNESQLVKNIIENNKLPIIEILDKVIYHYDKNEKTESNVIISCFIDELMRKNEIELIDRFIDASIDNKLSIDNLLFLLIITLPVKTKLSKRRSLYLYLKYRLIELKEDIELTLGGLE